MTARYALFASLDPHLWDIILDVLLLNVCTDADMFRLSFYPLFETFPCQCESTIRSWTGYYLRVHGPSDIQSRHSLFDCYRPPIDLIRYDTAMFQLAMTKRLANVDNPCRFADIRHAIHTPQHQPRPHTLSPPPPPGVKRPKR